MFVVTSKTHPQAPTSITEHNRKNHVTIWSYLACLVPKACKKGECKGVIKRHTLVEKKSLTVGVVLGTFFVIYCLDRCAPGLGRVNAAKDFCVLIPFIIRD